MPNITQVYQNALDQNRLSLAPVPTTITVADVELLNNKIRKYKITGWNTCRLFTGVNTTDMNILNARYYNALQIVTDFEQEKDKAVEDVYSRIKPYIKIMIETKFIPHIQDIILASETDKFNNSEISSALKALATELALKNIHVLIDESIARSTLENKIIEIINKNVTSGSETDKLNAIIALNNNKEFENRILSITPTQTQEELETKIWDIMSDILYEVKTIDELKAEIRHNPNLDGRGNPLGHEINEILNTLPPVFKELIKYKMMTNIPKSKEMSQNITSLQETDYLTEVDMLLMTLGFNAKKQIEDYNGLLLSNTDAFVDFRYLKKLSTHEINELLSSLSVSSYMILDYVIKNESISKKDIDVHDYNSFSGIFSQEEFDYLTNMINQNNLEPKTTMYYYAFLKNYIGTRQLSMNDKKFKNINKLFEVIRNTNSITTLGSLFAEWYENINLSELSVEELNELTLFSPEFMYPNFSQTDKLIYLKCKDANIQFQYYYKLNPHLFNEIIKHHKHKLNEKSIPQYYFYFTIGEIDKAYEIYDAKKHVEDPYFIDDGIVYEHQLISVRDGILNTRDYESYFEIEDVDLSEFDLYVRKEARNRRAKREHEVTRANQLREIIAIMKEDENSPQLSNYSKLYIVDAKTILHLSNMQRIRPECYLMFSSKTLENMYYEALDEILDFPTQLKEIPIFAVSDDERDILQHKKDGTLAREVPKMKYFEPTIDMIFLKPGHVAKNMEIFFFANNDLVATPSFLYKAPHEVDDIVKQYKNLGLEEPLPEEILYFSNSEIKENMPQLAELIQNEKDAESFSMESISKIRRILQKRRERELARQMPKERVDVRPIKTVQNELNEMLVTISPEFLKYTSERQKVQ